MGVPTFVPNDATWDVTKGWWIWWVDDWIVWSPETSSVFIAGVVAARTATPCETTLCTSGTFAVTLPEPFANADNLVANTGTGTVTVEPPAGVALYGLTGASGNVSLTQGESARIRSDGTSWYRVQ